MKSDSKNLPTGGAALDAIKLVAALFMIIDHINTMWFHDRVPEMALIGRAAFPLFCYAAACAVLRAGEEKSLYSSAKLLAVAVLVEPISRYLRGQQCLNVLFTLSFGMLLISVLSRRTYLQRTCFFIFSILYLYMPNMWEFSMPGMLLPAAIYFFLKGERGYAWWSLLLAVGGNMGDAATWLQTLGAGAVLQTALYLAAAAFLLPLATVLVAGRLTSERRLMPKYFLHVFYPAHMAALYLIAKIAGLS